MYDHNVLSLVGRLTKDVTLSYTNSGKAFGKISIANNPGKKDDDPLYMEGTVWGTVAENAVKYIAKGDQVAVSGTLHANNYENRAGQKVYGFQLNINSLMYLQKKGQANNQSQEQEEIKGPPASDEGPAPETEKDKNYPF